MTGRASVSRTVLVAALFCNNGFAQIVPPPPSPSTINTVQSGTGAVSRALGAKLNDTVNVRDFGAVCDGSTNDTAAFQAAHDASTVGLNIIVPPGTCIISANLNISKDNTHLTGAGIGASVIKATGSTLTNLFNVANSTATQVVNVGIRNLSVDMSAATNAARTAFRFDPVRELHLDSIHVTGAVVAFNFNKAAGKPDSDAIHLSHFKIEYPFDSTTARGILIDSGNAGNFHITDGEIGSLNQSLLNIGWEIKSGHGFEALNIDIYGWGTGFLVDPAANQTVSFGQFTSLQTDTSRGDGMRFDGTAAFASGYPYGIYNLQFVNPWSASNGLVDSTIGNGVTVTAAKGLTFTNGQFISNSGRNIYLRTGQQDTSILGGIVTAASVNTPTLTSNSGTYAGVEVENGTNSFSIQGVKSGQTSYYSNSQKYGILIGTGCSYYDVIGNRLVNNVTAGLLDNSRDLNSAVLGNVPQGNWTSLYRTMTAGNSDTAGFLTLASGTATYSFTQPYGAAPICTATDLSATAAVRVQTSTTTLTLTGTGTDNVSYICFGRN